MWIVGQGCSNRAAQERFQHSGATISRVFQETVNALYSVANVWITLPAENGGTPGEIATNPNREQARFRSRKGEICSFDMKMLYVLAGWEGSAHDAKVLADAIERFGFCVPSGKFYLVDAGAPGLQRALQPAPFIFEECDRKDIWSSEEEVQNFGRNARIPV